MDIFPVLYFEDQMAGFYRSQYTDSKGQKRFLATTQFEAIDARRCFPCWDEPAARLERPMPSLGRLCSLPKVGSYGFGIHEQKMHLSL